MRVFALSCLVSLVVVSSVVETAEAGRRRRRFGGAVAASASTSPIRRTSTTVVDSGPVVSAASTAVSNILPFHLLAAPDLEITEFKDGGEFYSITVKNTGQAAAPASYLQLELTHPDDETLLAQQKVLISPLNPGQVTSIQLTTYGLSNVQVTAEIDPENRISEKSERNNQFRAEAKDPPLPPKPIGM